MPAPSSLERRARRLLRWYPGSWRARYGEEFTELLLAELAEQPRAWRRTANVAHCGVTARLAGAGLAGPPAGAAGTRASLGTLTCSLAVFLTFGTAMWAQLAVGWQWTPPAALASFPPAELAWMVLSPAAALSLCTGAVLLARRLELSTRALRYETWIGRAAAAGMTVFLAGALRWVGQAGPGPQALFRPGNIDAAGLAVMAAALATGWLAISRARPLPPPRATGHL